MKRRFPSMLMLLTIAAYAQSPALKEGLWSIHTVSTDQPGNKKTEGTRSICRNHAYDDRTHELAKKAMAKCKINNQTASGATITTEQECSIAGTVTRSKGTATFAGDTAAHSETHTTYTPAMAGVTESTMIMDQKYAGPCPAGMEPGDFMAADGKITHRGRQ